MSYLRQPVEQHEPLPEPHRGGLQPRLLGLVVEPGHDGRALEAGRAEILLPRLFSFYRMIQKNDKILPLT